MNYRDCLATIAKLRRGIDSTPRGTPGRKDMIECYNALVTLRDLYNSAQDQLCATEGDY